MLDRIRAIEVTEEQIAAQKTMSDMIFALTGTIAKESMEKPVWQKEGVIKTLERLGDRNKLRAQALKDPRLASTDFTKKMPKLTNGIGQTH